jgi:hypothetical protein
MYRSQDNNFFVVKYCEKEDRRKFKREDSSLKYGLMFKAKYVKKRNVPFRNDNRCDC